MARRHMLDTFEAAEQAGPYDEYPVLVEAVNPQLHLSRNDRPQPFYLTCEKDTVLVLMAGKADVRMSNGTVRLFEMVAGDYAYIPAGVSHRILPDGTAIMYRYKAKDAGREAIGFPCETCDEILFEETWDTAAELPQAACLRIVEAFNAEESLRTCSCGRRADPIDLTGYRWQEIVEELSAGETEAAW